MNKAQKLLVVSVLLVMLAFAVLISITYDFISQVNNFFMLQYAQFTKQFLSNDQINYFTIVAFPINNRISMNAYNALLNGTYQPIQIAQTRYIANTGLNIVPLTTPGAITDFAPNSNITFWNYVTDPNTVTYANCHTCLAQPGQQTFYVYPIYVVQYTANCSSLLSTIQGTQLWNQINFLFSTSEYAPSQIYNCFVTNSSNPNYQWVFQALVGATNNTATAIDGAFEQVNSNYQPGNFTYIQNPFYNSTLNGSINGTILGYITLSNNPNPFLSGSNIILTNATGQQEEFNPIPNLITGNWNLTTGTINNGSILIDSLFCWNSSQTSLTNILQTDNYTAYPYLFQYQYLNGTYLCLSPASASLLLNITSNIDGSNLNTTPAINGLFNYPYLIVNQTAIENTYSYLFQGYLQPYIAPVFSNYWFIPNQTEVFTTSTAPDYEFSEFNLNEYLISQYIPIFGQEPQYSLIPIQTAYGAQPINAMGIVSDISTYFYAPLLQNLTYQYQFTQPQNGTPVYCTNICDYNNSLVYQDYGYDFQYANPDFGFVFLPQLNQTVYYTPQFSIVAETPVVEDTLVNTQHYGQYCFWTGSPYTCQYGLSPSQMFAEGNATSFIIYERVNPNATYVVNGVPLTGWDNFIGYLNQTYTHGSTVTIERLNDAGQVEWMVTGILQSVNVPFVVLVPQEYNINPTAYPPAKPLVYSNYAVIGFFALFIIMPMLGYAILRAKKVI